MKIAILIGSPDISGGTYVIFQHALSMMRRGHQITIVTEEQVLPEMLFWHSDAKALEYRTFAELTERDFDFAVATWWVTVYKLHRVNAKAYGYFVQSIESRFYREDDHASKFWAEATYLFQLPIITEASWIQRYLSERYGRSVALAPNGIRKDIYCAEGEAISPREAGKLRVLVEGPLNVFFKNTEKTIELCAQSEADEVWFLTASDIQTWPKVDRVFSRVSIYDTAKIYRSCDVIVKLSYVEGMFGPPLEMFHCGGTAIVYDVTGHEEYIRSGENSFVIPRDDEKGVVDALNTLKRNPAEQARLKQNALKTAAAWPDWNASSLRFEEELVKLPALGSEPKRDIAAKSELFTSWHNQTYQLQQEVSQLLKDREYAIAKHHEARVQLETIYESKSYQFCQRIRESGLLKAMKSALNPAPR